MPLSLVLLCHPPGPTTFDNPTSFENVFTATTPLHALKAKLLTQVATMRQYEDKQMK